MAWRCIGWRNPNGGDGFADHHAPPLAPAGERVKRNSEVVA
jgi:hypothetical protein